MKAFRGRLRSLSRHLGRRLISSLHTRGSRGATAALKLHWPHAIGVIKGSAKVTVLASDL